jgi:hypothetical protein
VGEVLSVTTAKEVAQTVRKETQNTAARTASTAGVAAAK